VAGVEPLVQRLVGSDDLSWLKPEYRQLPQGKTGVASGYGQYCLYRRGTALSVIVFCWGPRQGTPIHDHLSWGVLGFIDGMEKETRYKRVDDGTNAEYAQLEEVGVHYTEKGRTSHLVTPSRDVHKVENPGDTPSVSITSTGATWDASSGADTIFNRGKSSGTRPPMIPTRSWCRRPLTPGGVPVRIEPLATRSTVPARQEISIFQFTHEPERAGQSELTQAARCRDLLMS